MQAALSHKNTDESSRYVYSETVIQKQLFGSMPRSFRYFCLDLCASGRKLGSASRAGPAQTVRCCDWNDSLVMVLTEVVKDRFVSLTRNACR